MRVAFATLGCKVNQYDTATIETAVLRQGDTVVPFAEGADVYVVNTCTVTDRADAESRQLARRARRFNPRARVILTGCFGQASPERAAALPEIDHVIGIGRLADILRAVRGEVRSDEGRVLRHDLRKERSVGTFGAERFCGQTRAFLKVQEGCDLFCTFCIVPLSRGRSRSVDPRLVLDQLQELGERGYREVVLTGVHLGGYGHDLEPRIELSDLLEMIAERRPVQRIRLSSVDPPEVTPRLLRLLASADVFCPHLHIPVQSGSDRVLQRMRRQYDSAFLRDLLGEIVRCLPRPGIGTDVIAGFPGETAAESDATIELLQALPFTYLHIFPYSRRTGTTAAKYPDPVAPPEIARRARALRRLADEKRRAFAAQSIGRVHRVLLESTRDRRSGLLVGYSRSYLRVLVDGPDAWFNSEVRVRAARRSGDRVLGTAGGEDE